MKVALRVILIQEGRATKLPDQVINQCPDKEITGVDRDAKWIDRREQATFYQHVRYHWDGTSTHEQCERFDEICVSKGSD